MAVMEEMRPPGRSTRFISEIAFPGSGALVMKVWLTTRSKESSGKDSS